METPSSGRRLVDTFLAFSQRLAHHMQRSIATAEFLREAMDALLEATGCDAVGLWLRDEGSVIFHELRASPRAYRTTAGRTGTVAAAGEPWEHPLVVRYGQALLRGDGIEACEGILTDGGVRIPDLDALARNGTRPGGGPATYRSVVLLPLDADGERIGLLKLKRTRAFSFAAADRELHETLAASLALALGRQASRCALRERVKELSCLYGIARIATQPGGTLDETLQAIADLLPAGWLYPEAAAARIVFDGKAYVTPGFDRVVDVQRAEILRDGSHRGTVEVGYTERKLPSHEGPFLIEERRLIDTVAHDTGLIADRLQAEERRRRLEAQLRHADRLASVGQLAAGVAHELNEPLANILGFIQLAQKVEDLPAQVADDLDRAVRACLHAREVIRKLLLFARPARPQVAPVDMNALARDAVGFFEGRWKRQGIRVRRELTREGALVDGAESELRQVLVNLLANATQAMQDGGRVTVRTRAAGDRLLVTVADTGVGMTPDVRERVFLPFFTTRGPDGGTGLGLSVVHGIVTAHGGTIRVESEPGRGTRFEVDLPRRGGAERRAT